MKRIYFFVSAFMLCITSLLKAQEIKKSKLNVLYIGGSANFSSFKTDEEKAKDVQSRMSSFEEMLSRYFEKVTVVNVDKYTSPMSANYDVTVVDAIPKTGGTALVFPSDFDLPVLFIGETGSAMGTKIGLKFDWYCLCLEGEALRMKREHEIFKGPFPVKMAIEKKDVPEMAKSQDYRGELPAQIDMWEVQTKNCRNTPGYRPGLVSHYGGFGDSPEAEVISGGVSGKDITAVSLARHGSFFHWGFSGAPDVLKPSAQAALANAVVYISKFKGTTVIARKFSDRIATTKEIEMWRDLATPKGYEVVIAAEKKTAEAVLKMVEELQARKDRGEGMNARENQMLSNSNTPKQTTVDEYLRSYQSNLYPKFGKDFSVYENYYKENMPYFYSNSNGEYSIDEDLKQIKIAKNDLKLLDYAIRLLEKNHEVELGRRLLNRYTLLSFDQAKEWRSWYESNKSKLFFTESGGYHFLVNAAGKDVQGNDYTKKQLQTMKLLTPVAETSDQSPVQVSAATTVADNAFTTIVVRVKIHPGYHIYGYVSEKDPFIKTELGFVLPQRAKLYSEMKMPQSYIYNENGTAVYKDEAIFVQEIVGSANGEVICKIKYQCCNNNICLPPVEEEIKIKLKM